MYYVIAPTDSDLYHHGILGQKWGVKYGPPYPLTSKGAANKIYEYAKKHVNKISRDVISASKISNSKPYGLEHRLKTKSSITRKIEKKVKEDGISIKEAASDIKDAIRFTTISSEKVFVSSYEKFKEVLENKGYEEIRCKNYFDLFNKGKVKHKSVQSTFRTKDGYEFEVQFQTPSSQDAKNKKIPIYEERRQVGISKKRAKELERQMYELALNVKDPDDISRIKTY